MPLISIPRLTEQSFETGGRYENLLVSQPQSYYPNSLVNFHMAESVPPILDISE